MTRNNIDDKLIDCFEDSGRFVGFEVGGWYITLAPGRKKPSFKHSRELNWSDERATQFVQENPGHKEWGVFLDTICVVHADDEAAVAQLEQLATNSGARGLNGSHEGGAWLPQACERNACKGNLVAHQGGRMVRPRLWGT